MTFGITQTIQAPTGDSSTYWSVGRVSADLVAQTCTFDLCGWINSDAKAAGDKPLDIRTYSFSGPSTFAGILSDGQGPEHGLLAWVVANQSEFSGGTIS